MAYAGKNDIVAHGASVEVVKKRVMAGLNHKGEAASSGAAIYSIKAYLNDKTGVYAFFNILWDWPEPGRESSAAGPVKYEDIVGLIRGSDMNRSARSADSGAATNF